MIPSWKWLATAVAAVIAIIGLTVAIGSAAAPPLGQVKPLALTIKAP